MRALAASALIVLLTTSVTARAEDEAAGSTAEELFRPRHRYAFVAGGALFLAGLGLGYIAQGDAQRAQSVASATDTRAALADAQRTAATANVCYGLAGLAVVYALALELLPNKVSEKATLTFHF